MDNFFVYFNSLISLFILFSISLASSAWINYSQEEEKIKTKNNKNIKVTITSSIS